MADRLTKMIAFVKTAELGSFSAAGASLAVSSQIIGRHVAELEQHLGIPLLTRTTRNQKLTEAGQLYLEGCRRALGAIEDAEAAVAEHSQAPRGVLRVTAPVEIGAAVLAPRLPEFLALYPDVKIDLMLDDRVVDLIDQGFDVGIRIGQLPNSELKSRALVPFRLVTCASKAYVETRGLPQTPEDLGFHDCLDYSFHNYPAPSNWTFASSNGEIRIDAGARIVSNNGHALVEAALANGGIIRTAELAVAQHLKSGRLLPLLEDYASPDRPMHLLYPAQKYRLPKLRVFVDWVIQVLPL